MSVEDIDRLKYYVCCPMCDNKKCVKDTDRCEAKQWADRKKKEAENERVIQSL